DGERQKGLQVGDQLRAEGNEEKPNGVQHPLRAGGTDLEERLSQDQSCDRAVHARAEEFRAGIHKRVQIFSAAVLLCGTGLLCLLVPKELSAVHAQAGGIKAGTSPAQGLSAVLTGG